MKEGMTDELRESRRLTRGFRQGLEWGIDELRLARLL